MVKHIVSIWSSIRLKLWLKIWLNEWLEIWLRVSFEHMVKHMVETMVENMIKHIIKIRGLPLAADQHLTAAGPIGYVNPDQHLTAAGRVRLVRAIFTSMRRCYASECVRWHASAVLIVRLILRRKDKHHQPVRRRRPLCRRARRAEPSASHRCTRPQWHRRWRRRIRTPGTAPELYIERRHLQSRVMII